MTICRVLVAVAAGLWLAGCEDDVWHPTDDGRASRDDAGGEGDGDAAEDHWAEPGADGVPDRPADAPVDDVGTVDGDADGGTGLCAPAECSAACVARGYPGGSCDGDLCLCEPGGGDADVDTGGDAGRDDAGPCDPFECLESCRAAGYRSGRCDWATGACVCEGGSDADAGEDRDDGGATSCVPECGGSGRLGWVDPCTGTLICTAWCTGCTAVCESGGWEAEGWYADCGGSEGRGCDPRSGLIVAADCM
jgi:hypothetical protein